MQSLSSYMAMDLKKALESRCFAIKKRSSKDKCLCNAVISPPVNSGQDKKNTNGKTKRSAIRTMNLYRSNFRRWLIPK